MEVYLAFLVSLMVMFVGLWMLISPRSFLRVYALQLRGLGDVERWTRPSPLLSLLQRLAGLGLAAIAYVFVWATWSAIHGEVETKPHAVTVKRALRTDGPWAGLVSGVVMMAFGVYAAAFPDMFVRLICRYALFLGEPTVEGIRKLRVFARVIAAMAIIGGGWLVVGSMRILIS